MFNLGEVKIPTEQDFEFIRKFCESEEGWTLENSKRDVKIYTKTNEKCPFRIMKAKADYKCSASCLYDVVQDSDYCDHWDERKDKSLDICRINNNSDIIYYSIKMPKPFKNRDFIIQRCWIDYGQDKDKIIFNHSVNHAKFPPRPDKIRGISFITATLIRPTSARSCTFYFISQSDPGGLPAWIVNLSTKIYGPKFVDKMHQACLKYDKWKSKNNPNYKPWAYPEQSKVPMIDWNDISQLNTNDLKKNSIDETKIGESDIESVDIECE